MTHASSEVGRKLSPWSLDTSVLLPHMRKVHLKYLWLRARHGEAMVLLEKLKNNTHFTKRQGYNETSTLRQKRTYKNVGAVTTDEVIVKTKMRGK